MEEKDLQRLICDSNDHANFSAAASLYGRTFLPQ